MLNKVILLFVIVTVVLFACNSSNEQKKKTEKLVIQGEILAKDYCARCHAFPKAEILPTKYWGRLMPIMGFFLGAGKEKFGFGDYRNPIAKQRLTKSGLFPETPVISLDKWIAINNYYLKKSPSKLYVPETPKFNMDLAQFNIEPLPWKSTHDGLTYLNFDRGIYELGYHDTRASYYLKLDEEGNEIQKTQIASQLVDVDKGDENELLLLMGKFENIDAPSGKILKHTEKLSVLVTPLERPINFEVEDFNNDGKVDILVAEFGKFLGGINIYSQNDTFSKINIHPSSGAVKTIVKDVNGDGLKDFYVLVTQADESIYLFLNEGDFNFTKKRLLQLPPHYGTTHFELIDFDGDGDDDIICSSGDSWDYGAILKPFHGVRIFENLGNDKYEEVWFHAQQGAYGTASADYDNDGDIDIASIGYFASTLEREKESFIYFENKGSKKGKWQFEPHGIRGNTDDCWILITNADIDNDGDLDIILGANSRALSPEKKATKLSEWQENGGMVTILKNNLIN